MSLEIDLTAEQIREIEARHTDDGEYDRALRHMSHHLQKNPHYGDFLLEDYDKQEVILFLTAAKLLAKWREEENV